MRILSTLAAAAAAIISTPAFAAEDDFNIWGGQFVFVDLDEEGDVFVRLEAQERFTQDAERLGQLLLRSYIGAKVSDSTTIGGGYAYILTDPVGPPEVNEHRIYQEVTFTLASNEDGLRLTSRNRFEQRFFEEDGEMGLRYRNQVQLKAPLTEGLSAVVYTEPFIGVNDTRFNRDGLAVWRNFVGVSFPVTGNISLTPGYLNQTVFRTGENRMDHIANVGITGRF